MASNFDQYELLLREFISPSVINLELKDDDIAWSLMDTMQPVASAGKREYDTTNSKFPEGYEARFEIKVQSGGRVAGGTFLGNTQIMMGKDTHLASGQAADGLYLDPRLTPARSYIQIALVLKRIIGSVTQNHQQVMADLATNPVEDVAMGSVEDAVRRLRSYLTNCFYSDGSATIAQVNNTSGYSITETAGGVTVAIDGGTWGRFMKGDILVAGSDADVRVQRTGNIDGYMVVVAIDQDNRNIKLQSRPGEGTISLSDNDHLMLAGTFDFDQSSNAAASLATEGIESLLVNSGTFPGSTTPYATSGLDVTHHTELMAFIKDDSSAMVDPTMDAVTELLDKIVDLDEGEGPTAFIAERSIWTLFAQLERENNAAVMVPMGANFNAAGGVSGPVLSHQDMRFQRFSSKRIRPNSIFGMNPSTFRKFIPLGDRAIQWVYGSGPLAGFNSIFGPVTSGTQLTELADAPFNSFAQFGCLDPRLNFRRLGIKAQRDV